MKGKTNAHKSIRTSLVEFVTVNVTVPEGLTGYEVTITEVSTGTLIAKQTTPSETYKIPHGVEYYVEANEIKGYPTPGKQTFVTSQASSIVTVTYEEYSYGVYISGISGKLYTTDEWNNQEDTEGVALIGEHSRFVIAKEDVVSTTVLWGGRGKNIPNVFTTRSKSEAVTDFDGVGNTNKIISVIGNTNDGYRTGSAAGDCKSYSYNKKQGYLGAAGEWDMVGQNKDAINRAFTLIGGEDVNSMYWTSTIEDDRGAWGYTGLSVMGCDRYYTGPYVRAFLELKF